MALTLFSKKPAKKLVKNNFCNFVFSLAALMFLFVPNAAQTEEFTGDLKTAVDALNKYEQAEFQNLIRQKPQLAKLKSANGTTLLHLAVMNNYKLESAKILLANGAPVDAVDKDGETPIFKAANSGSESGFNELLIAKANLKLKNKADDSLLHAAARGGSGVIGKTLLEAKIFDVNAKNAAGDTALLIAADNFSDAEEIIAELIKANALVNLKNAEGKTALHLTAERENPRAVDNLLAGKANPNIADNDGNTPIFSAVGRPEIVTAFITAKADITHKNNGGTTVLHIAAREAEPESVRILLNSKAAVDALDGEGNTPLMAAIESQFVDAQEQSETVQILIENNAKTDYADADGNNLLHLAAGFGNAVLIELLASKKLAVEAKNANGETPLLKAVIEKQTDAVDALLEIGVNPNAADAEGATAIYLAADKNAFVIAKLLLAKKADVNQKDVSGETPLLVAVGYGNLRFVTLLIKNNVDVNSENEDGNTALHRAVGNGNLPIVKLLLVNKAVANKPNRAGQTPREIAEENNFKEIAALLPVVQ